MSTTSPVVDGASYWQTVKKLLLFSLPVVANSVLGILPTLASIWILSRLGKDQLAAAAIAAPTFYTVLTVFVTGFYAVGIKVGYCFGQDKQQTEIGDWVRHGFVMAFILSVPAVVLLLNAHHLLLWLGQDPHLVKIAEPFFVFGAFGMIIMLFSSVLNQYFVGIGHPRVALILSVITLPLVVALSYVFVLGRYHFPQLGLAGINCAALIVDSVVLLCAIAIATRAKWSRPYQIFSARWEITKKSCMELIHLGWPISIQVGGELLCMTMAAYLLGLFGVAALAAAQITGQFVIVFIMISMGLSSAVAILVSQAHGAQNTQSVRHTLGAGLLLNGCVVLVFILCFWLIPTQLVDWYLDIHHPTHSLLVEYAVDFMLVAAVYLAFDGVRNVLTSTLRGLQDPKVPMKIGLGCLWLVGLPAAAFCGFVFPGGPVWLRIGFTTGVIVGTIWLVIRCRATMRRDQ